MQSSQVPTYASQAQDLDELVSAWGSLEAFSSELYFKFKHRKVAVDDLLVVLGHEVFTGVASALLSDLPEGAPARDALAATHERKAVPVVFIVRPLVVRPGHGVPQRALRRQNARSGAPRRRKSSTTYFMGSKLGLGPEAPPRA